MRHRKRKLVDPVQFEFSIRDESLITYQPAFGDEMQPVTDRQKKKLEKMGIFPEDIKSKGLADCLIAKLEKRKAAKMSTPKQIRFLESRGFRDVGTWGFESSRKMICRIQANGWRIPFGVNPSEYKG